MKLHLLRSEVSPYRYCGVKVHFSDKRKLRFQWFSIGAWNITSQPGTDRWSMGRLSPTYMSSDAEYQLLLLYKMPECYFSLFRSPTCIQWFGGRKSVFLQPTIWVTNIAINPNQCSRSSPLVHRYTCSPKQRETPAIWDDSQSRCCCRVSLNIYFPWLVLSWFIKDMLIFISNDPALERSTNRRIGFECSHCIVG